MQSVLTTHAHVGDFQVLYEAGVAGVNVVERLVIDSQRALAPSRALPADHIQNVRRTAQVSRVFQHRLEPWLNLHAPTDFHSTISGTQHHDDVTSATARRESFTGAILGDYIYRYSKNITRVLDSLKIKDWKASPLQYSVPFSPGHIIITIFSISTTFYHMLTRVT